MKSIYQLLWIMGTLGILMSCSPKNSGQSRVVQNLNHNWLFAKDLPEGEYSGKTVIDSLFTKVVLPHTAHIEPIIVNDQWQGTCWYRHWLEIPENQKEKKHFLYFEGAMQNADVYINGKHLAHHLGGYLPFIVDITDNLDYTQPNLLAVKLVNTDDSLVPPGKALKKLDFNWYGGIYRPVKLISTSRLYITNPLQSSDPGKGGIIVEFDSVSNDHSLLRIKTTIHNDFETTKKYKLHQTLIDSGGRIVSTVISKELSLPIHDEAQSVQKIIIDNPNLWSPSQPYLYQLVTQVFQGHLLLDSLTTPVGIRKISLTEDGLILNGKKTFLRGTNRHQEYPYIGYALSNEAQWRDAVKIKNAGFDLVRLSHYPQSEAFMNACDALGIVTIDCIPGWQYNGNEEFKENVLTNTHDLIRRDRNHPSVFFWELSLNESWMEPEFMDRILQVKTVEFGDQPALTCAWIDYNGYDLFIPARQHGQPPSYWNDYMNDQRPILIAEYGDWEYYAQNAGFNQSAYADLKDDERTSRQSRGSGEKRLLQQALNYQESANSNRKGKSTIGHANWLMFDYNRGYTDDLETSGIADIFRIPKYAYYFYQSQRDFDEVVAAPAQNGPMVFIASEWQPQSSKTIKVFSNCDEVELLLNGRSLGNQSPDQDVNSSHLNHPPFTYYLEKFEPGLLEAVGYINEKKVTAYQINSPELPTHLKLEIDESGISPSENDVVFVYASVRDQNGTICPVAGELIEFFVQGDGELIGENPVATEAGIATILLKTGLSSGNIAITAHLNTLKDDTINIKY